MAYTVIVTKQEVRKVIGNKDYTVTIHVIIQDEISETVLEDDYSVRYNSNVAVSDIKNALQIQIQKDWDKYVGEQAIYGAVAFDTIVSEIQTAANTYINL